MHFRVGRLGLQFKAGNMKPSNTRMKIALALVYFMFAILLNSVGTVILQVILCYGVENGMARQRGTLFE